MANNSRGLTLYDNDYMRASIYIENYCSSLIGIINAYSNILIDITSTAIVDQNISNSLTNLANEIIPLAQVISEIAEKASSASRKFVEEVDDADDYLY